MRSLDMDVNIAQTICARLDDTGIGLAIGQVQKKIGKERKSRPNSTIYGILISLA